MEIKQLVKDAHTIAVSKGWHKKERSFEERIELCHIELRDAINRAKYSKNMSDVALVDDKYLGVAVELADVVIRIADICGLYGIDLDKVIEDKLKYNRTRKLIHDE